MNVFAWIGAVTDMTSRFEAFLRRKEQMAREAVIPGYTTVDARPGAGLVEIGNTWSERLFDGPFFRSEAPAGDG